MIDFLLDAAHWSGSDGIPTLVLQHLMYTFLALVVAAAIAIPLGLYIGHTGRGSVVVAGLANSLRALPTIGLLILLVIAGLCWKFWPGSTTPKEAAGQKP